MLQPAPLSATTDRPNSKSRSLAMSESVAIGSERFIAIVNDSASKSISRLHLAEVAVVHRASLMALTGMLLLSACGSPQKKLDSQLEEASSALHAVAVTMSALDKGDVPRQYARKLCELTSDDLAKLSSKMAKVNDARAAKGTELIRASVSTLSRSASTLDKPSSDLSASEREINHAMSEVDDFRKSLPSTE